MERKTFALDRYGNRRLDQYDAAGNVLTDAEGRSFTYDAENKQKEVKNASNQTIGLYYFDGDGRRVKKMTATETVIFVFDAAGKLVAEYSTSLSQTPQVEYLTNDHLGTPRINTNENGAVVSRTDYMPYGEEIIGLGGRSTTDKYVADDVRQGFTGYLNDEETGLDYAQARMYKKEFGRFTGADQIFLEMGRRSFPQSFNLFSYVRNNPLSFSDPTGLDVLVSCKTNGKTKAEVSSQQAACESGTSTNLNNRKSAQFKVVVKDGRLAIVGSVDRATLSDREKKLYDTITDSGPGSVRSTLNVFATSDSITFGRYDGPGANSQMIGSGTKLGASVTVLVRDRSPNPKRSKGIIIEEVEYIETSIVGVPCNRQSWVTAAQKALRLAEKRASRAVPESNTEEEEVMSKENAGAEPREKTAVAFPLTVAAMEKGRTIRDALAKGEAVTLETVVVKGMFNDILAQEPTLWELYDILWEVRWQLSYQVWNLQALGQTDFTEILALWAEALDEFKAAAIVSFRFWNDIADAELESETDDEAMSYALELEKSLKAVAGAIESATDGDARKHLRAAGDVQARTRFARITPRRVLFFVFSSRIC